MAREVSSKKHTGRLGAGVTAGNRPRKAVGEVAQAMVAPEAAVAFTGADRLARFVSAIAADPVADWPRLLGLGDGQLDFVGARRVSRIHFGNEFCERLLPSRAAVESALELVTGAALGFSLAMPMLTDDGIEAAEALLAALPDGSEVVVNDWGLMRRVRRHFPGLVASAGRLLCRMLKEPRAPSASFMELGGHGFMSPGLEALLGRLGVSRLEIDLPPFARPEDLRAPNRLVSVHVPFGFSTTGRICRIGSLHQASARKFATGHRCARECLTYVTAMETPRAPRGSGTHLFQRGNTILYRHTLAMNTALADAIAARMVDRIVVSGDWNETRRPDLSAG
jgi:hypothetical protein